MFQRHEVLWADDGHTFRNPVTEELPTIHPTSFVVPHLAELMAISEELGEVLTQ